MIESEPRREVIRKRNEEQESDSRFRLRARVPTTYRVLYKLLHDECPCGTQFGSEIEPPIVSTNWKGRESDNETMGNTH